MDFGEDENNFEDNENNEIQNNNDYNYNEMENDNDMNNNIEDDNNNFNNNINEYDSQIEPDNNFNYENEDFNENDLYELNMENIKLKNRIQNMKQVLIQKNNEINDLKVYYSQQIQLMNKNLSKYKNIAKNYSNLQNEINSTKQKFLKEIKIKNKIIFDLQKGVDIKDLKVSNLTFEENQNLIFSLIQQIKSIEQDILEEPDSDVLNQEDFQKLDNDQQAQLLFNELQVFSQKLSEYKNKNMSEILRLRNLLESNNDKQKDIKDQLYIDILNLIKMLSNKVNDIKFPEYSINDNEENRYDSIINIIKILVDYIMNKAINKEKNDIDEELDKRLKEMSELLVKSNQNLSISTKNNSELKLKYDELKEKYDNLELKIETEKKKLMNDLNKKNQQIKSLEHLNTRLSNQIIDNKIEDKKILINKKPASKYGKISKGKNIKKIDENNTDKLNLFIKDDKAEKNLELFLNKFTNGEYESFLKNNNENIDLDNLKNEIDKFTQKINKDLGLADKK